MTEQTSDKSVEDARGMKTARIVGSVLLLIAAWNLYRGRTTVVVVVGGVGALLLFAGFFVPTVARHFHTYWMKLAAVLGYVNSRILLSVMFYTVVTPYGIISKLIRRNPLQRRGQPKESYWIPRKHARQSKEQFERLF